MVKHLDWHNLYGESWKNEITPGAFVHPAKYSRALIRHIYAYLLKEKLIQPGDTCIDPFGGVALGGLDAALSGLHWVGCELEQKFVTLGTANIALWNSRYAGKLPRWGSARLLQGDSRNLRKVIAAAECAVSSPPYAQSLHLNETREVQFERMRAKGQLESIAKQSGNAGSGNHGYGDTDGQLAAMAEGNYSAAISSPPYEEARIGSESGQEHCGHGDQYGGTEGQLGAMKSGGYDAAVSSPPYEGSPLTYQKNGLLEDGKRPYKRDYMDGNSENYGGNKDNIANAGDFWSAAKQVVAETYAVLAPGAVAVFVVKDFIRNKARVPFCDQWRQLCEACGFSTYAIARAWLVEDHGTQLAMDGNHKNHRKSRKSFFRRLAESKGSPAIDWEIVLIMKKS